MPYLDTHEDSSSGVSGLGNSEFGVKWRFCDGGKEGWLVSIYPRWEFNNPGSAFKRPFQFGKEIGPVTVIGQVGHEFRSNGDRWFYGIACGHHLAEQVEAAIELAGGGTAKLGRTYLMTNLGVVVGLNDDTSLMFSLGRELYNQEEPRAALVGYLGVQRRL